MNADADKKLTPELLQLYKENEYIVKKVIKQYTRRPSNLSPDDVRQLAYEGYITAVLNHHEHKGSFKGYAWKCACGAVLHEIRSARRRLRREHLYLQMQTDLTDPFERDHERAMADLQTITRCAATSRLFEMVVAKGDPERDLVHKQTEELLHRAVDSLERPQRQVVRMMYFEELNLKKIHRLLGYSYSTIRDWHIMALKSIYTAFQKHRR